jgi:DNA-binding IclR family transcriptional regulator
VNDVPNHPLNAVPRAEQKIVTSLHTQGSRRYNARSAGVAAVLDVLEALDRRGALTLSELARETGVPKSTLHRVCKLMSERGWIARDPAGGRLELGRRVAWLARPSPASSLISGFRSVARRLVARHNETTGLTVLEGAETVFVAKEDTSHPLRLVTTVGSRLPAFASASGRVMLADLSDAEVRQLYDGRELRTPTGRRLEGMVELVAILDEARRRGYAENIDETALGLHCIAAPVGPPGGVAAAITLCVPSGRMRAARKRELLYDLVAAARELTSDLGSPADQNSQLKQSNNLDCQPAVPERWPAARAEAWVDTTETRRRRAVGFDRKVAT